MAGSDAWLGRPYRSVRTTPRRPGWYGCEDRIAWLLRVNRLYGSDQRRAQLTNFAAAFRGGCWSEPVSASRVSRWETGASRAGYRVLRRYEELLELPGCPLVAAADWVYRRAATSSPTVLDRSLVANDPAVAQRAEALLDQALSRAAMTGADWDTLTAHLETLGTVFLYPAARWADLAQRLVIELVVAERFAWAQRIEALARLMDHHQARPHLVDACATLAADRANQVFIEPLAALDLTNDPDANRHVLAQLANPTNERALRGALLAAIAKVAHRHFARGDVGRAARLAADLLGEPRSEVGVRELAVELLSLVPGGRVGPVGAQLRRATSADPVAGYIADFGRIATPDAAARLAGRLADEVVARVPNAAGGSEAMLIRLLDEMLFSPNGNAQVAAALVLAATPYRQTLGAVLCAELGRPQTVRDGALAAALLAGLRMVGGVADRPVVERLVVTPGLPAQVAGAAAWTIGHVGGASDAQFWRTAIARYRDEPEGTGLRGLVYGLGMVRHRSLLGELRVDTTVPYPARAAASWWLDLPGYAYASATT